jgi:hypothetical protein
MSQVLSSLLGRSCKCNIWSEQQVKKKLLGKKGSFSASAPLWKFCGIGLRNASIVLLVCIVGRTPFPQIKQSSIDIAKLVAEACKA